MDHNKSALMGVWRPVSQAPRDGTPIILWLEDTPERPPYGIAAGFWELDAVTGSGCWCMFGEAYNDHSYSDEYIRGWKPLLRKA